jgi:2-(1,2-epoxy-1,2-dihydrophenyl)acetyl-CoA isomerase
MNTAEGVEVELGEDHVATVTFARPPSNFFDLELVGALADAFEALDAEPACRAIVLRSEGKHFCAGAQLGATDEDLITTAKGPQNPLYEQAVRLAACAVPVVAAVQGAAIGGGLGVALVADFRVAAPEARFAANFSLLGMHQGFGISVTLPAVVGQQHAMDLLYTGRRVTGEQAHAIGLVDRLVPLAELVPTAHAWAAEIAASAPLAVRSIRQTLRGDLAERMGQATLREHLQQRTLRQTEDYKEGVTSYAERRPARFQAR